MEPISTYHSDRFIGSNTITEILSKNDTHIAEQRGSLTLPINLFSDKGFTRTYYAFDTEMAVLGLSHHPLHSLSGYFPRIDQLAHEAKRYVGELSQNEHKLSVVPFFYTFEPYSRDVSLSDKLLLAYYASLAGLRVKRKALGLIRKTLRGLTLEEKTQFQTAYEELERA